MMENTSLVINTTVFLMNPPTAINSWVKVIPLIVVTAYLILLIVSRPNINHNADQNIDRPFFVPSHTIALQS